MIPFVIECENHQFAPYSLVCSHLTENPDLNWVGMDVKDGREVEYDWICDECFEQWQMGDTLEEVLIPVCINCVRKLMKEESI